MFNDNETILTRPASTAGKRTETTVTEAELETVYRLCRLSESDIDLDEFKASPWPILREHGQEGAVDSVRRGYLPLLPAQAAVAKRVRGMEG